MKKIIILFVLCFTSIQAQGVMLLLGSDGTTSIDTIPSQFTFHDSIGASVSSYHTAYIVVAGCDSARFYPASGDTLREGALGTKTVSPIWIPVSDTLYTFCVASATNSDTTHSIIYSANGTPLDTFSVTTVAAGGETAEVFAEDFEGLTNPETNFTGITESSSNTIEIANSPDTVYEGTKSAKFYHNNNSADCYMNLTLNNIHQVYFAGYYYQPYATTKSGWHQILDFLDGTTHFRLTTYNGNQWNAVTPSGNASVDFEAGETGAWVLVEYCIKSDSVIFKINGVQQNAVAADFSGYYFDSFRLGHSESGSCNGYIYWDAIRIDTTAWVGDWAWLMNLDRRNWEYGITTQPKVWQYAINDKLNGLKEEWYRKEELRRK